MKKFIGFLIFVAIIGIGVVAYYPAIVRYFTVPVDEVDYFKFKYTAGYSKDTSIIYAAECNQDDVCVATVKLRGVAEEHAPKVDVDRAFMRKIRDIIEENEVNKWNGFDKTNSRSIKGDAFSIDIRMANNRKIFARGYMKWPKNYSAVREQFDQLFKDLVV